MESEVFVTSLGNVGVLFGSGSVLKSTRNGANSKA
jgi:hypothetical protein